MKEIVLIPQERVAVLIGKKGADRRNLEQKGDVKLWIDSKTHEITINGAEDKIYFAARVVELVGRGFSPDTACKVFDDRYCAEIINLRDFGAKERKTRKSMLARLIGTEGKTKHIIEKDTNTAIVIYGKTVGIIGKPEDVEHARLAVEAILTGSKQGTAYKFLRE